MGGHSEVILLTGGTSGIGRAAARQLAERGVTVLITGRRRSNGQAALAEIRQAHPESRGAFYNVDFTNRTEIRRLATDVESDYDRLDGLVNNAGTGQPKRVLTDDGIEKTFAVNYVAPFLLTNLLVPRLCESSPARVLNTVTVAQHDSAADMHGGDLSDLDAVASGEYEGDSAERSGDYEQFYPEHAYVTSKLALLLFTYELADRLAGTGVRAACFHPGLIGSTDFVRDMPLQVRLFYRVVGFAARIAPIKGLETRAGAGKTMVHHILDRDLPDGQGVYFNQRDQADPGPRAHNEDLRRHLWEYTADIADCAETGLSGNA